MLEQMAHSCVLLEKRRVPDGAGGAETTYADGISFKTYPSLDISTQAKIAEAQGVTSVFTVRVDKDFPIDVGDYFRDEDLKMVFRVTSDPDAKKTPDMITLDLKAFTAERTVLPG